MPTRSHLWDPPDLSEQPGEATLPRRNAGFEGRASARPVGNPDGSHGHEALTAGGRVLSDTCR